MANQNLSRKNRRNYKRSISVFTAILTYSDEIGTSADVYQLTELPPEIVITRASVIPLVASDAATSATVDLGIDGGNELIAAGDLKSVAGTDVTDDITSLVLETGGTLTFKPTYTGAVSAGKFLVVVEYIEYQKVTGEITNYVPEA